MNPMLRGVNCGVNFENKNVDDDDLMILRRRRVKYSTWYNSVL